MEMILGFFLLMLASFAAGSMDSIAGGGGIIMLPSLLLSGITGIQALATNKLIATFGTSAAIFNFIRGKKIIWKIIPFGIVFSLLGSYIGVRSILMIDQELVVKIIIALLPVAVFITIIPKKNDKAKELLLRKIDLYLKVPIITFLVGFYDGAFGPGTGSLLVLGFHLLLGFNLVHASGTAKIFNITSNIAALAVFIVQGHVLFLFGLPLIICNVLGNYLGSHLTVKKGSSIVKGVLSLAVLILCVTLVFKYLI